MQIKEKPYDGASGTAKQEYTYIRIHVKRGGAEGETETERGREGREGGKESARQDERLRLKEGRSTRMVSRRSLAVWHPYSANYHYTALVGLHEVAHARIAGADFTAPFVG